MKRRNFLMRVICMLLCIAIALPASAITSFADEKTETAGLPEIKGDYYRQYASTLFEDGKIACSDETADLSVKEKSKVLEIKGDAKTLKDGEITISKTFNFDGKPVARFSFDASSAKGQKVTLGFYLDDSEEPFVTKTLPKQRKKNSWAYSKEYTVDTLASDLKGEHTLKIKVLDASENSVDFAINWFEFVESSVPVVYLDIDEAEGSISEMNSSEDHSAECYGTMSIKVPEGYTSVDSGETLTGGDYTLEYIRGRGNSTWTTDKKPYKIKLDSSSKVLGMGKNKHWVLLANYFDNSLLRNRITYWLGKQLGMDFTPSMEPVDVVMNGEYYGSYFLSEQIRVDKSRVNIFDLEKTPGETDPANITGGYLLSMCPYGSEETKKAFTTKEGVEFLIESPEFEDYENDAQADYITNYVQSVENAIYGENFTAKDGTSYTDLMDIESTALYYWMQEFSKNGDGYISGSTYLYKPANDKLYWGPLWDFDYVAWGSTEYEYQDTEGWLHNGDDSYSANWNNRLFEDPVFARQVVASWDKVKPLMEELTRDGGQLDIYHADMDITARYNFEKWGPSKLWEDEQTEPTYAEEIQRLKNWINDRTKWVDKHVKDLEPVETTITFKNSKGKTISTQTGIIGKPIKKLPEAPAKKGYTFDYWSYYVKYDLEYLLNSYDCENEDQLRKKLLDYDMTNEEIDQLIDEFKSGIENFEVADKYTPVIKDMVLTAVYISDKDKVPATNIYLNKKNYYGFYDEGGYGYVQRISYQLVPFDVAGERVTLSTDNENVLTIVDDEPIVVGPGRCTLTATTSNGKTATAKVRIFSEAEMDDYEDIFEDATWYIEPSATVKAGAYHKLKFDISNPHALYSDDLVLLSSDDSTVEVAGNVIHALKPGKASIICISNGSVSVCDVKVPAKKGSVGTTVTRNGIKYKVTANKAKTKTVTCIGPEKKTVTKAVIPSYVSINGKKYKVTKIKSKAFKDCKKLKKATIGKNVEIVEKSAFSGCRKLSYVRINASQAKIYKSTFKNISKKAVYSVPKKNKAYYNVILKGKKIKYHK